MNSNQNSIYNDFNCEQMYKDCKQGISSIINGMPFFIKIIIFSTLIFYVINLFTPYISFVLVDIPYYTILHFQIWRLFTTPFITTGLLSIIFSLLFWYRDAVKQEQEKGTQTGRRLVHRRKYPRTDNITRVMGLGSGSYTEPKKTDEAGRGTDIRGTVKMRRLRKISALQSQKSKGRYENTGILLLQYLQRVR